MLKRIIIFLIATLLILTFLDFVLGSLFKKEFFASSQSSTRYELDNRLIFKLKSNQFSKLNVNGHIDSLKTNNLGFRSDKNSSSKKKEDSYRIISVGDSFTYGYGLSNDQAYPFILEQILNKNKKNGNYEVINAGVPGYSPDQEYRFIVEKLPDLKPDLIIWNIISYDLLDFLYNSSSLYQISAGKLIPLDPRFSWHYALLYLKFNTPDFFKKSYVLDLTLSTIFNNVNYSGIPKKSEEEQISWINNKLILEIESAKETARKNKIKLIVVRLPTKEDFGLRIEDLGFTKSKNVYRDFFSNLEIQLTKKEIPYFDLVKNIDKPDSSHMSLNKKDLFFERDIHPSELGARKFAEIIADYLIKENFLN